MYALKEMIEKIFNEGLEVRWERHAKMAEYTRNWANNRGQKLFTNLNALSNTLTCIDNTQNWDINKINEQLLQRGYRMDRGYGKYRGKAFRVPHMGNIYMDDLIDYLNTFEEVLCQLKY